MVKLYYSMQEASRILDVKPHILRHWERELDTLRPRRKRGRRIYSPEDIKAALVIKNLLSDEGYTLPGARRRIREDGLETLFPRAVRALLLEFRKDLEGLLEEILSLRVSLEDKG